MNRQSLLTLFLLLILPATGFSQSLPDSLKQLNASRVTLLAQGDTASWVDATIQIGRFYEEEHFEFDSAAHYYQQLSMLSFDRFPDLVFRYLFEISLLYMNTQQFDSAEVYFIRNLSYSKQKHDAYNIGKSHIWLAFLGYKRGEFVEAAQQITLAEPYLQWFTEDYDVAEYHATAHNIFWELGMIPEAEQSNLKCIEVAKQADITALLDVCYHNMGFFHDRLGDVDQAIVHYNQSLSLNREIENTVEVPATLIRIGNLYGRMGEQEKKLAYFEEAYETNVLLKRLYNAYDQQRVIAQYYMDKGEYEKAQRLLEEAHAYQDKQEKGSRYGKGLIDLGYLEITQGRETSGLNRIHAGIAWAEEMDKESTLRFGYRVLGDWNRKKKSYPEALSWYKKGMDLAVYSSEIDKVDDWIDMARAYRYIEPDSAFRYANQAIGQLETARTNMRIGEVKAGFFERYNAFYNQVASWYIVHHNDLETAFRLVELAKAKSLYDQLAGKKEQQFDSWKPEDKLERIRLERTLDTLYANQKQEGNAKKRDQIKREIAQTELAYTAFLATMSGERVRASDRTNAPMSIDDIQDLMKDDGALIEYAFTEHSVVAFVFTEEDRHAMEIPVQPAKIDSLVGLFRDEILQGNEKAQLKPTSDQIWKWLIQPVWDHIRTKKDWVIVPGGSLALLPFEALITDDSYLVEQYTTKYLPSMSSYEVIQDPHRNTPNEFIGVAVSGFETAEVLIAAKRSDQQLGNLPFAGLEVREIAAEFNNPIVLEEVKLDQNKLLNYELETFNYLHFATHGLVDDAVPSRNGILLSLKKEGAVTFEEEQFLTAKEVSYLNLNADLVVLSACNSGLGKQIQGEGFLGMQRSFFVAGASSVVSSLWSVNDKSTAEMMPIFYSSMSERKKKDYGWTTYLMIKLGLYTYPLFDYKTRALRDAKLEMIAHPYFNKPIHWAPFVIMGR
ncbi:MAG: CHAT domain-containing tetratricopeptide repeat protein [Bacteroidota bacterium]